MANNGESHKDIEIIKNNPDEIRKHENDVIQTIQDSITQILEQANIKPTSNNCSDLLNLLAPRIIETLTLPDYDSIREKRLLKGIRHEDSLISQRLTWLLVFNGFLFAFFGQLVRVNASGIQKLISTFDANVTSIKNSLGTLVSFKDDLNSQELSSFLTQIKTPSTTPEITEQNIENFTKSIQGISPKVETISNDIQTLSENIGKHDLTSVELSGMLSTVTTIGILISLILLATIIFYLKITDDEWKVYDSLTNNTRINKDIKSWFVITMSVATPVILIVTWIIFNGYISN